MICDDDRRVFYNDINPLSDFVADAMQVIGFDPEENFIFFITQYSSF